MPRNPSFCSFATFSIVSLTPFINKPDYSTDLTLFIYSVSSFEIINVAVPKPTFFYEFPDPLQMLLLLILMVTKDF